MKKTFLIFAVITSNLIFSQTSNPKNQVFNFKYFYFSAKDDNGGRLNSPIGFDAEVTIDNFYKTYEIIYTTESGGQERMKFKYVSTYFEDLDLYKDTSGKEFFAVPKIFNPKMITSY